MTPTEIMRSTERDDADLVAQSLGGSRQAFREIVERYQTLICSLAYSATGNLSQSQDVAQETFLTAWTQLRNLREPDKLRGWLAGIARHKIQRSLRQEDREPTHQAEPLEEASDSPAGGPLPFEQTISREEEAILWRALENIPQLYREPLVLYYREHQSIEHVASALELTEDAVKQRLSRGRKLLQEEVQAFVESALRRTAPREAFSGAVLAMLPLASGPVATAGLGAGAQGTALAKSGLWTAWLLPLAPFLGIAAGVGAQSLLIGATVPNRKERLKQFLAVALVWIIYLGLAVGGETALHALARRFEWSSRVRFVSSIGFWWLFVLLTVTALCLLLQRLRAKQQGHEATGEIPPPNATPLKPGTLALVVAGNYLMFAWMLRLTWMFHDGLATAVMAGALLALAMWSFLRLRGCPAPAVGRALGRHLPLAALTVLVVLNLRAGVWVAAAYGVTVAEARQLQPTWIIPVLSLVLIGWTALMVTLTQSKATAR